MTDFEIVTLVQADNDARECLFSYIEKKLGKNIKCMSPDEILKELQIQYMKTKGKGKCVNVIYCAKKVCICVPVIFQVAKLIYKGGFIF